MEKVIKIKNWIKIASFAIILYLLIGALNSEIFSLLREGNTESLRVLLDEKFLLFLAATLLIMTIQNTFTVIPLFLLISVNVALFGFMYGYVWSWITSVVGGVVVFLVIRYWFQAKLLEKTNEEMKNKIEKNGFNFVFIARVFPFVPTSIINIAAGVSSISLKDFTLATVIGNMIYIFVLALVPFGLLHVDIQSHLAATLATLIVLFLVLYRPIKKRKSSIMHYFGLGMEGEKEVRSKS